jgi:hypothetical protein
MDFESKFREWFNLVSGHDPQYYQDLEWEWEDEIYNFLKNPDKCLREERKWKKEMDDKMQRSMEKDLAEIEKSKQEGEYFTNCFGIKMRKSRNEKENKIKRNWKTETKR